MSVISCIIYYAAGPVRARLWRWQRARRAQALDFQGVRLQRRRIGAGEEQETTVPLAGGGTRRLTLRGLSAEPLVFAVDDFLTPEELDTLSDAVDTGGLRRSELLGLDGKFRADSDWRQSSTAFIQNVPGGGQPSVPGLMTQLSERVAQMLELPTAAVLRGTTEMQVQRYERGELYYPHYDSFYLSDMGDNAPLYGGRHHGLAWPYSGRFATAVLYLTDNPEGGETVFPFAGLPAVPPELAVAVLPVDGQRSIVPLWKRYCENRTRRGVAVSPRRGRAVFFYNHHVDPSGRLGEMDLHSVHGSCPSTTRKDMANFWVEVPPGLFADTGRYKGCTPGSDATLQYALGSEVIQRLISAFQGYLRGGDIVAEIDRGIAAARGLQGDRDDVLRGVAQWFRPEL